MESTTVILAVLLCSLWSFESQGAPVDPSPQAKALNFMRKFGYIEGSEDGSAPQPLLGNLTKENFKEAIKEVQRFGGLEITGELDEKTLELMSAKRCGVADVVKDSSEYPPKEEDLPSEDKDLPSEDEDIEEHHHDHDHVHHHDHDHHHHHHHHSRRKRYILQNRGWNKRHLTYYLSNWSEHLTREEVLYALEKALGTWAKYGNLNFTQVSSPDDADIVFGFYRGKHIDAYAFDGPGSVLAHAFSPISGYQNHRGIDGDVHFDADEKWEVTSEPSRYGVDLLSTALHELGHSLGLSHSPERDSVMFPYYTSGNHELGYDDILAMHQLYIKRRLMDDDRKEEYVPPVQNRPPPTRRTTTTTSTTTARYEETTTKRQRYGLWHGTKPPQGCNGGFDTVAYIRGELFITKNKMLWRLNRPGDVQKGYPVEFRRMFALPENVMKIDAMYERQTDSSIIIFSGNQFWVHDGKVVSGPRPLTDYGLPPSMVKVDAVAVRNGSTYIFSDKNYWTFDDERQTLMNSSRPLRDWGFPLNSVDSVMTYKDGKTYFFKGDHFSAYDGRLSAPKSASQFWLSC